MGIHVSQAAEIVSGDQDRGGQKQPFGGAVGGGCGGVCGEDFEGFAVVAVAVEAFLGLAYQYPY